MPSVTDNELSQPSTVMLRNGGGGNGGKSAFATIVNASLAQIGVVPPKTSSSPPPTTSASPAQSVLSSKEKRLSRMVLPTSISLQHYDNLIGELRCPGCTKPLQAPIKLCQTGHSICAPCTDRLPDCPICQHGFTQTRSKTLEAIAAKAEFNCANMEHGCTARLPADVLIWHEQRCIFQVEPCFMGKVWDDCEWSGSQIDWLEHCREQHGQRIFSDPSVTIQWQSQYEAEPPAITAYYIFHVYDQTFNLYQLWDQLQRRISWSMICASKDPSISRQFGFECELFAPADPLRLALQRVACHSERDEDVLQPGRCASFDMTEVSRFMDAFRVLHYRIRIVPLSQVTAAAAAAAAATTTTTAMIETRQQAIKAAKDIFFNERSASSSIASAQETGGEEEELLLMMGASRDGASSSQSSSFEEIRRTVQSIEQDINKDTLQDTLEREFPDVNRTSSTVNSVPKPPRHSIEMDIISAPPLPESAAPTKLAEFAKSNVQN